MTSESGTAPAASTSKLDDSAAGRLKALQAQIAARKRKRAAEAEAEVSEPIIDVKGKGRAVSFAENDAGPAQSPGSTSATSILKPGRGSQEDAFRDAKAAVPKEPVKEKTVAKKRYLKAKLNRRKAAKRAEKGAASSEAGDVSVQGGEEEKQSAEERKAIKRAKREERNAKRIAVLQPEEDSAEAGATEAVQESTIITPATDEAKEARKVERKAKKEAKRLAASAEVHEDGMVVDGLIGTQPEAEPPSRKERKQQALLDEYKAIQEKANKKAAKAARKAKFKAETLGLDPTEAEEEKNLPPTQPDALPRFPAPQKPSAPDQRELDDMAISAELKDAIVLDQSKSIPLSEYQESASSASTKLSEKSMARLAEMQIESLFAVQAAVLPILLEDRRLYSPLQPPRDVCVSAPTGSGKTLGYVVPIVEILSKRIVTHLRALVVLPTRDLVMQVRDVFEQFLRGTSLKIGTATGQHSFSHEQSALVEDSDSTLHGGSSKVDILIVTPGRLMDHLKSTRNFTLQHLRFLVIDEADRLLNQSFNDWLKTVLSHIEMTGPSASLDEDSEEQPQGLDRLKSDAVAPALMSAGFPSPATDLDVKLLPSTQKLLFSATLTRDPARVAALHLNKPIYLAVTERRTPASTSADGESAAMDIDENSTSGLLDAERKFSLPATLKESMIVTNSLSKPLLLFHLLHTIGVRKVLCLTKSVESASRLVQLVAFFEQKYGKMQAVAGGGAAAGLQVANYSSDLTPGKRKEVIERFVKGELQILVCSDLIARGMDIQGVQHVINYDVPVDMRKYVHRVGRTARAGKEGEAWSLVETQEANHFKGLMKSAGRHEKVRKVKVKEADLEQFNESYESALARLRQVYTRE